ncbi:MAG: VCBS domain-containing protein, partial [Planctomycetota bacterium]
NGGSDTQDVTISITGSNDTPVITPVDVAGTITEGGTVSEAGSITFTDLDLTDTPTATEVTKSVTTALTLTAGQQAAIENAFTISADAGNTNDGTINWDYTIADADLDFLADGQTVTVVFTITVDDGNGGSDTQDVTINITGSNDTPVITPVDVAGTITEGGTVSEAGSITFTDLDLTDTPTATEVTKSVTTALTLTAGQQAAIENAFTISPDAGNTNDGTINWDYTIADADLDFLADGETVTVVFTITVDDGNGGSDTQDVTINITGSNDSPVITPVDVAGTITEGGTVSEAGSITFTDLDLTDLPTATEVTQSVTTALTLTPAQQAAIENAFTISAAGGNTNNGTINWDYTIADADLDFLAAGETVTVVFTITVDDGNGGSDTQDVTISITGSNDTPVITPVDVAGTITEGGTVRGGTVSEAGSITFTDLDLTDTPTATEATASVTTALTLTPAQQAAIENAFTVSAAGGNTNNGTINWDYTIADADLDFLAAGDTVTVVFTITVDDGNGGTDTQDVTIDITGSNDAPVITPVDVAGTITEGGTVSETGSITFTDLDLTDLPTATEATASVTTALTLTPAQQAAIENAFTISPDAGNTNDGTINWDYTIADADLDFLAAGETVTVVFTITVDDGNGGTGTQDVTIDITGANANEAPVITPVDVAGTITEGGTVSEAGSITFTDLDLADLPTATEVTQSVTTALTLTPAQQAAIENAFTISAAGGNTNDGTINWDYTIADADLDFLAAGETVTVVFTITVDDGNGGTDTQDVTITIIGTNDAPVAVADAAETAENTVLNANVPAASDVDGSIAGYVLGGTSVAEGSLVFNADGSYSFDPGSDFDDLVENASRDVTFTYTAIDNSGAASAEQMITITVTGSNDLPVIGGVTSGSVVEDVDVSSGMISSGGKLTISDPDAGESSYVAATIHGEYGVLTIDSEGNWNYSVDNFSSEIQSLHGGESLLESVTVTTADGTRFNVGIRINGAEEPLTQTPIASQDSEEAPSTVVSKTPLDLPEPPEAAINTEVKTALEEFDSEEIYTTPQVREPVSATPRGPDGIDRFVTSEPGEVQQITLNSYRQEPLELREQPVLDMDIDNLDFQVDDDEYLNERLETALLNRIEMMRTEIDGDASNINSDDIEVKVFIGATTSLTAGIVNWVLRGGSLLASLMGTVPLLNRFDPIPILKSRNDEEDVEPDDEDTELTGPAGEHRRRVKNMFSDNRTGPQDGSTVDT